jgi:hypothetical protein
LSGCSDSANSANQTDGIGLALEAGHHVIGIAHDDHVASGHASSPARGPQVEDVVQVDVGEQRRDHRSLPRPLSLTVTAPSSRNSRPQPLADQADDALVADPMLDEADQPVLLTVSKNDRMLASNIQFTFRPAIPTIKASSASCGPRPGGNPYENPRNSFL